MKKMEEPRTDCALIRMNQRTKQWECSGLNALYCRSGKCNFYRTEPVKPPDPLYAGPAVTKKPPKRIPDEVIRQAARMHERGFTWAMIGKELGHEPRAIQNRVCHDRRLGKC
jgi:hypothetical protein